MRVFSIPHKTQEEFLYSNNNPKSKVKGPRCFNSNKYGHYNNKEVDTVCIPCCEAKQTRLPFPHSGSRANVLLEIVHTDLCGPMETPSAGGGIYFITFIDDYSRKVYVYFLRNKMDIISVFIKFKEEVENETEKKINILRSDNGKEYCNKDFSDFLAASGIKHQTSTPYTPEQNGVAERMNLTLVERAKCMLFEANLEKIYWAEAVGTAAYITNRSPSRVLAEVTPYEKWTGKKPNISHLRIFGSKVMVHVPKANRLKWDRKSHELIFVGYCDNTKGYRMYDPVNKRMVISRNVIFIENNENVNNITQEPVSVPPPFSITLNCNNESLQNRMTESEETLSIDSPQNDTQDATLSPSSSDTSFDSCKNVRSNDETYDPSESDYDSNDSFQRNITLRPHRKRKRKLQIHRLSKKPYLALMQSNGS